jgi:polar amino acid transport system substrate-binding protein
MAGHRRLSGSPLVKALLALAALGVAGCAAPSRTETAQPLVVASDLDNLPFAGVDGAGTPIGRDVEMMEALAVRLGRPLEWHRMPFEELLPAVEAGRVDVVCATLGHTPERAARVEMTRPYYTTEIAVVVRTGEGEPASLAALAGRPVSAARGTTSERAVHRRLPDAVGVFENKTGLPTAERLLGGEVDAAVMDGPAADVLVATSEGRLTRLASPLDEERYVLALQLGDATTRRALDTALADMERAGELTRLDERHGLQVLPAGE